MADVLSVRITDHAIIYGLSQSDEDRLLLADSWTNCPEWFFTSRKAHAVGTVTPDSIRYVAGYCQKKLTGEKGKEEYGDKQPPFQLSSQKLGLKYFEKNVLPKIKDEKELIENGRRVPVPHYFTKKFELDFQNESTWFQHKVDVLKGRGKDFDFGRCHSNPQSVLDYAYYSEIHSNLEQQGYNLKIKEEMYKK